RSGEGLHTAEIVELEPVLTDELVQEMLGQLESIRVVTRAEEGEWVLSRDLDTLSLAELYEAGTLRIPIAEAHLPRQDDALGRSVRQVLDELRVPLRELLKRRISSIHHEEGHRAYSRRSPAGRPCLRRLPARRAGGCRRCGRTGGEGRSRRPGPWRGRASRHRREVAGARAAHPRRDPLRPGRATRQVGGGELLGDLVHPVPGGDAGVVRAGQPAGTHRGAGAGL